MADTRLYVQGQDYTLSGSGVIAAANSVTLASFKTPDGTNITMADFGTLGYITFEPETSREENASFTGVTQNGDGTATLTGLTRGLGFVSPYTAVAALDVAHAGGTLCRVTNSVAFYNDFANKHNDETITETWTFTNTDFPQLNAYIAPTADAEFAPKKYVDDTAVAGAPDMALGVKGIAEQATTAEINADTSDGSVGRLATNPVELAASKYGTAATATVTRASAFAADAEASDAYVITLAPVPLAYTAGMTVQFTANTANTGGATINVNGLGAQTILKGDGATALETGDIASGQVVSLVYDGVNFQMQSPSASPALQESIIDAKGDLIAGTAADTAGILTVGTNGKMLEAASGEATGLKYGTRVERKTVVTSYDLTTASGDQVIAHGMTETPIFIEIVVMADGGVTSIGTSNGVTHSSAVQAENGGLIANSSDNYGNFCAFIQTGAGAIQKATAALGAANITLTWTKTGAPSGTAEIMITSFY